MLLGPLEPPEATVAAAVDRAVLGINHIWSSTKTWDPEGPLSTLPAIATALFGVLAGEWISRKERPLVDRIAGLFGAGSIALLAGLFFLVYVMVFAGALLAEGLATAGEVAVRRRVPQDDDVIFARTAFQRATSAA